MKIRLIDLVFVHWFLIEIPGILNNQNSIYTAINDRQIVAEESNCVLKCSTKFNIFKRVMYLKVKLDDNEREMKRGKRGDDTL